MISCSPTKMRNVFACQSILECVIRVSAFSCRGIQDKVLMTHTKKPKTYKWHIFKRPHRLCHSFSIGSLSLEGFQHLFQKIKLNHLMTIGIWPWCLLLLWNHLRRLWRMCLWTQLKQISLQVAYKSGSGVDDVTCTLAHLHGAGCSLQDL